MSTALLYALTLQAGQPVPGTGELNHFGGSLAPSRLGPVAGSFGGDDVSGNVGRSIAGFTVAIHVPRHGNQRIDVSRGTQVA